MASPGHNELISQKVLYTVASWHRISIETIHWYMVISFPWFSAETIKVKTYDMLMAKCKTAVSPLLMHWRYCSLALRHGWMWHISIGFAPLCTHQHISTVGVFTCPPRIQQTKHWWIAVDCSQPRKAETHLSFPALGVNTMSTDALAFRVARASAGMVLAVQDRQHVWLFQS